MNGRSAVELQSNGNWTSAESKRNRCCNNRLSLYVLLYRRSAKVVVEAIFHSLRQKSLNRFWLNQNIEPTSQFSCTELDFAAMTWVDWVNQYCLIMKSI